jgi:hypothetical protein
MSCERGSRSVIMALTLEIIDWLWSVHVQCGRVYRMWQKSGPTGHSMKATILNTLGKGVFTYCVLGKTSVRADT